jgi:MFS family permease
MPEPDRPVTPPSYSRVQRPRIFYGWAIVAVGFLAHLVCAFHMSSTLSVFLKPLTEDLHVSRGLFSLLRSGEIIIGAVMAPFIGPLVDRYGGRWLVAGGALMAGSGFLLLGLATEFWQFLLVRWGLVTLGGVFMCQVVITVTIARWFVRRRGRAVAIASLGQGMSKVAIPLVTAALFAWIGWRQTWMVFGVLTFLLVVFPAIIFLRRSPEDMGMKPDGIDEPSELNAAKTAHGGRTSATEARAREQIVWSRREVLRTKTFWLICLTYGIVNVGIAGLNLHIFAYVSDIGYPDMVAATVMSIIAFTQLLSTLLWGLISERMRINKVTMIMFLVQGVGLTAAISTSELAPIYLGFFIYGAGLGGSQVLQELIWANYYGRVSLGTVRGLGILISHSIGAAGAPFFGFLHDASGSYLSSFVLFIVAVMISAFSILWVRAPEK